jgi:serine/threonine protein kinase
MSTSVSFMQEYRIRALIGEGTLGTVYAALHPSGARAAVKVLHHAGADKNATVRFLADAHIVQSLHHPHVVDLIEAGTLPAGHRYLMTELLVGETLGERLRRVGSLPIADVLDFAAQAASALDAAHEKGLVHGRLTREDLFLVPDLSMPRGERVKVLDLGTASLRRPDGDRDIPAGSVLYRAPEADGDRRADVYALAGLLYHALCGVPPFSADNQLALAQAHRHSAPPSPRAINAEVPGHVAAAILKGLKKRPQDRFATMTTFIDALSRRGRSGPRLDRFRAASMMVVVAFSGTLLWSVRSPAGWAHGPWQEVMRSMPALRLPPQRSARGFVPPARPPAFLPLPSFAATPPAPRRHALAPRAPKRQARMVFQDKRQPRAADDLLERRH